MDKEFERLETALFRAGHELAYPATPALASRVRLELTRETSPAPRPRHWARLLLPLAAALILALALLFAFPDARDAVAQFMGLRGLRIFYAAPTPTAEPTFTPRPSSIAGALTTPFVPVTATPRASATPTIKPFSLCCETTLQDAQHQARFKLLVPPNQAPSKVYYQNVYNNGEQVVMRFGSPQNPLFTLYQAQRWIYGKLVQGGGVGKEVNSQTLISETTVKSARALWFSGAPHLVMMLDARGEPIYDTRRVVDANTLVWETGDDHDGIIYRIETTLPLDQAVQIAESLKEYQP